MLTPVGCLPVSAVEKAGKYSGAFTPLPLLISNEKISEMIEYYDSSFSERRTLQREALKDIDMGDLSFTKWYLNKHYFKNA